MSEHTTEQSDDFVLVPRDALVALQAEVQALNERALSLEKTIGQLLLGETVNPATETPAEAPDKPQQPEQTTASTQTPPTAILPHGADSLRAELTETDQEITARLHDTFAAATDPIAAFGRYELRQRAAPATGSLRTWYRRKADRPAKLTWEVDGTDTQHYAYSLGYLPGSPHNSLTQCSATTKAYAYPEGFLEVGTQTKDDGAETLGLRWSLENDDHKVSRVLQQLLPPGLSEEGAAPLWAFLEYRMSSYKHTSTARKGSITLTKHGDTLTMQRNFFDSYRGDPFHLLSKESFTFKAGAQAFIRTHGDYPYASYSGAVVGAERIPAEDVMRLMALIPHLVPGEKY